MERLGVNWTDHEVQSFIAECYDRDALLNVLMGYGAQWLEGRLVCVVTKASVQPFLARGWSSWGDDDETTEEFAKVSVPVKGSVTLRAVVEQGIPTVGEPEKLGLDSLFEETSVLAPDKVAMIPLQMGGKTKMLLIGEPRVSTQDLDAFSHDIGPLFIVAECVTDQLEELIKLAKTRKLPPKSERVPAPPATVIERLAREDLRSAKMKSVADHVSLADDPFEDAGPETLISEVDDADRDESSRTATRSRPYSEADADADAEDSVTQEEAPEGDPAHTDKLSEVSRTDLDGYFGGVSEQSRATLKLKRRTTSQIEPVTGQQIEPNSRKTLPIDIRGKQNTARELQAVQQSDLVSTTQSGAPVTVEAEVRRAEQELLKPMPLDIHSLPSDPFDESSVADLEPDSWASALESAKKTPSVRLEAVAPKRTLKIERDAIRDKLRRHMERGPEEDDTRRAPDTPSAALQRGAIPVSPRPLKTDPDVPQDVEDDGHDVAIIQPIGIGMENPMGRQTLMGGFSMEDLKRAHDAHSGSTRVTMQGVSAVTERPRPDAPEMEVPFDEEPSSDASSEPEQPSARPDSTDEAGHSDAPTGERSDASEAPAVEEAERPTIMLAAPGPDDIPSDSPVSKATLIAFKTGDGSIGEVVSFAEAIERISEAENGEDSEESSIEEDISAPILDALSQVSEVDPSASHEHTDGAPASHEPTPEPIPQGPVKTLAGVAVPLSRPPSKNDDSDAAGIELALADDVPSISPEYIEFIELEVEPLTPSEEAELSSGEGDGDVVEGVAVVASTSAAERPVTETVRLEAISGAAQDLQIQRARYEARSETIEDAPAQPAQPAPVAAPAERPATNAEQIAHLISILDGRDRDAAFELASKIEGAPELVPHLMKLFPGRLYIDRYQWPVEKLAAVEDHGPVLRALVNLGEYAAPAIAEHLEDSSLEVRFYATYMFTKIPTAGSLEKLYARLDDRDRQTRAVAVRALSRGKNDAEFAEIERRVLDDLTQSNDTSRVESAAKLLGLVLSVEAIPELINTLERHGHRTGVVIHHALQQITLQSMPQSVIAWRTWWGSVSGEGRAAWVLRAMNAPADEVRVMVAAEIARLKNVHINYHPDQPPSLRSRAQGHLKAWLDENPDALG